MARPVTKRLAVRRKQVNALFNAMAHEKKLREWAIFRMCYGNEDKADAALLPFLKEVALCPAVVISYCQQALAPKAQ